MHYDAWAYRCDEQYTPLTAKDLNRLLFERGEAMVPVYSCFGGLGIYTQEAYRAGVYDGHDIEHVGFHRSLRQKGYNRIFLNPNQITVYGRKHRKMDRIAAQFGRWLSVFGQGLSEPWQFAEPFASPGTQRRLTASANDAAGTRRAA